MVSAETRDSRGELALSLVARINEMATERPGTDALIAVNSAGNESRLTWRELRQVTAHQAEIITGLRNEIRRPIIFVKAASDLPSAVGIISALSADVPVMAISPKGDRAFYEEISSVVRERYGQLVDDEALADRTLKAKPAFHVGTGTENSSEGRDEPLFYLTSSGSTGKPKVIPHWSLFGGRGRRVPNILLASSRWRRGQRQLIISSLYHLISFAAFVEGVIGGCTTVLQERFAPAETLTLIREHGVEWFQTTPMHMREMLEAADDLALYLGSIRGMLHGAGPCPSYVKREWTHAVTAKRLYETYGATEGTGATLVNGNEWLKRPGTVGRGLFTDISIRGEDGFVCEPGEVGQIYMRPLSASSNSGPQRPWLAQLPGGWQSLGDIGWVDDGDYLYVAGRRDDQVVVEGVRVLPARIDAFLTELPGVRDAITFIVTNEGGRQPSLRTLVIESQGARLSTARLLTSCRERLPDAGSLETIEIVASLPRSEIGKVRRRISAARYKATLEGAQSAELRPTDN